MPTIDELLVDHRKDYSKCTTCRKCLCLYCLTRSISSHKRTIHFNEKNQYCYDCYLSSMSAEQKEEFYEGFF